MESPLSLKSEKQVMSHQEVETFRQATLTETTGIPLTFATRFRELEFRLLEVLKVNFKGLLHTEQKYEYLSELAPDDLIDFETEILENKVKRGLQFVRIRTTVKSSGVIKIISDSQMVIRQEGQPS